MGPGGWGLDGAEGLGSGGGWTLRGRDRRSFFWTFFRLFGGTEIPPSVLQDIVSFGSAAQKGARRSWASSYPHVTGRERATVRVVWLTSERKHRKELKGLEKRKENKMDEKEG